MHFHERKLKITQCHTGKYVAYGAVFVEFISSKIHTNQRHCEMGAKPISCLAANQFVSDELLHANVPKY